MKILKLALRIIDKISNWVGTVVSFGVLAITALIVFDVFMRYVLNDPTKWAGEVSTMMFGAMWLLGGAYALLYKSHVNMDALYGRLSQRKKAILDLITAPLFYIVVALMLWKGGQYALLSISNLESSSSVWGPPVYPIKTLIPVGAALILLQGIAQTIRNIYTAATRKELQ